MTRAPCVCRSSFASDAHQSHVPTSSEVWKPGNVFQTLWDAIFLKNYALFQGHDQYRHNIRVLFLGGWGVGWGADWSSPDILGRLFSGILRDLVVSRPLLSIAPVTSV